MTDITLDDIKGFFRGALSLFSLSTWQWMKEATKEHENMTLLDMVGIVLFNQYRTRKHFEQHNQP